jgi:hypothetical protein
VRTTNKELQKMSTINYDMVGTAQFTRLTEVGRDMGVNLTEGSDQRNKIEACQGMYLLNLHVTKAEKAKAIAAGVPNKGLTGQLWKTDKDGGDYYKCTRKHFNPKFTDRETGEQGVVMGPPNVFKDTPEGNKEWDWVEDGLIGDGSSVKVRLSIYKETIVEMTAVKVLEHVVYIPEAKEEEDF